MRGPVLCDALQQSRGLRLESRLDRQRRGLVERQRRRRGGFRLFVSIRRLSKVFDGKISLTQLLVEVARLLEQRRGDEVVGLPLEERRLQSVVCSLQQLLHLLVLLAL